MAGEVKESALSFPLAGVSRATPFGRQPGDSTPDALNVCGVDPLGGRKRGGQRPGFRDAYYRRIAAGPDTSVVQWFGDVTRYIKKVGSEYAERRSLWRDVFANRRSLGSLWAAGGGTLISQFSRDFAYVTNGQTHGAVISSLPIECDTAQSYSVGGCGVNLWIYPYRGAHYGKYKLFLFCPSTYAPTPASGLEVELDLSVAGQATVKATLRPAGVVVAPPAYSTPNGARGGPLTVMWHHTGARGWWCGKELFNSAALYDSTLTDKGVAFSMSGTVAGGRCQVRGIDIWYGVQQSSLDTQVSDENARTSEIRFFSGGYGSYRNIRGDVNLYVGDGANFLGSGTKRVSAVVWNTDILVTNPAADRFTCTAENRSEPFGGLVPGRTIVLKNITSTQYSAIRSGDNNGWATADCVVINREIAYTSGLRLAEGRNYLINKKEILSGNAYCVELLTPNNASDLAAWSAYVSVRPADRIWATREETSYSCNQLTHGGADTRGRGWPAKCSALAIYQDRLFMAGSAVLPHEWFASRQGNPFDMYLGADPNDVRRAVIGSATDAGTVGEPIRSLIVSGGAHLLMGCVNGIWRLTGNPCSGGVIDNVVRSIAPLNAHAWCLDPAGTVWFLAHEGLFRLGLGVPATTSVTIEEVSRQRLPAELRGVSSDCNVVMAYDAVLDGVVLVISGVGGGPSHGWLIESGSHAMWPLTFPTNCEPFSVGYEPRFERTLYGCRDGRVRCFDPSLEHDEASDGTNQGVTPTSIASHVFLGPISAGTANEAVLADLRGVLGAESGDVTWAVHAADTPEAAVSATAATSGTFSAGLSYDQRVRVRGGAFAFKLSNAVGSLRSWMLETLIPRFVSGGRLRRP